MTWRRHIWLLLALPLAGCDLPPIPTFDTIDAPAVTHEADGGPGAFVACAPSSRKCIGNSVRTCSVDGIDFQIEACGAGETCGDGACQPIQGTCRGPQPFALSETELAFDVSDDLKSQTKQLRLENCGTKTFILREAVVRGPARPDGTPVFRLASEVAQTAVAPGDVIDLKVVYSPTTGLSHVAGKLELSLVLDELTNVEIALRSTALCAAATPVLDFGLRPTNERAEVAGRLQNCGTQPIRLEGWDAPATYEIEVSEKLPAVLEPAGHMAFYVSKTPEVPGFLEGAVEFSFDDPLIRPSTTLRGLATDPECIDMELSEHQVLVNNQPVSEGLRPRPGSVVRVRFPDSSPDVLHWVRLIQQPLASYENFARVADGFTIRPRVVGVYRGQVVGYDIGSGRRSCESGEFRVEVEPDEGLHVELIWAAIGDGIPEDLGFGHGANLDLHVLSTQDGAGEWNNAAYDCFPGVTGLCGRGQGTISISESGGIPEFVSFAALDDLQFEIGVYLSNPFNFDATVARIRVFRDREPIASLTSDSLQSANDFWLVGRWDETERTWTEIDRVFSGFPK